MPVASRQKSSFSSRLWYAAPAVRRRCFGAGRASGSPRDRRWMSHGSEFENNRSVATTRANFVRVWSLRVNTDSDESLAKIRGPMQNVRSRHRKPCLVVGIALALGMLLSAAARSQRAASPTNPTPIELAKSVHNPFEDFVKVPIQATTGFNLGNHHDAGEAVNVNR